LRESLPEYARSLYEAMFAPDAPHSTTHVLIRDFARNTIELARRLTPGILKEEQIQHISPPFTKGGLRDWRELEPDKTEDHPDGPFGMDFRNYTIGRLVPGRNNYDDKHPEYQRVLSQMRWRLNQLGYSFQRFGEIDNQIARSASYERSEENVSRIDCYGKKYSWIAFFEQYGLRDDGGLLDDDRYGVDWRDPRPSDVDIDPSFPSGPDAIEVISEDLLGDKSLPLDTWILQGPGPDIGPYLVLDNIDGDPGPWVLLDGFISQEDKFANREFFAFPRSLLVRQEDSAAFLPRLARQKLGGRWLPEIPGDHYIFGGEIPWSPLFPTNGWTRISFADRWDDSISSENDNFDVIIPVRSHQWESYHSGANESYWANVPAREIAESLGLWLRLPSWDFYDPKGQRVTRLLSLGSSFNKSQKLLYLRRDALDHFLGEQGLSLVWGVWGERRVAKHEDVMARKDTNSDYADFQSIFLYENGNCRLIETASCRA
ncbi:MAG: hypothetical protein Q7V04_08445, partial [Deltaproteobacteria bacterium]|nr:hypothetical protein [Deltaproteobacteria bacterium]